MHDYLEKPPEQALPIIKQRLEAILALQASNPPQTTVVNPHKMPPELFELAAINLYLVNLLGGTFR